MFDKAYFTDAFPTRIRAIKTGVRKFVTLTNGQQFAVRSVLQSHENFVEFEVYPQGAEFPDEINAELDLRTPTEGAVPVHDVLVVPYSNIHNFWITARPNTRPPEPVTVEMGFHAIK